MQFLSRTASHVNWLGRFTTTLLVPDFYHMQDFNSVQRRVERTLCLQYAGFCFYPETSRTLAIIMQDFNSIHRCVKLVPSACRILILSRDLWNSLPSTCRILILSTDVSNSLPSTCSVSRSHGPLALNSVTRKRDQSRLESLPSALLVRRARTVDTCTR